MTHNPLALLAGRAARLAAIGLVTLVLAACAGFNPFGPPRVQEEPLIAAEVSYQSAIDAMDNQRYMTAIEHLERLERQHPYSELAQRAKVMQVYANFRISRFEDAILAADRFLALYPNAEDTDYVLYLKGTSYFNQMRDTTRDQGFAEDALDTYTQLVNTYPNSQYAAEARDNMRVAVDQIAGREMSVGRYYLGHGQYTAAINRFRVVVEDYDTTRHIEEALYRLTEAYLRLGLLGEAQSAAAVLGHNYPASEWYQRAYQLLGQQGLAPQQVQGNWLTARS